MSDLLHVTAVLKESGLIDTSFFTDEARERGSAVHLACQYHDEGDLNEDTLDESVAPRLAQYRRFLIEKKPIIIAVEMPVESTLYGYCGKLDRIVHMDGRSGVLDIKGPTQSRWHGVQLAAYRECLPADVQYRRWSLHLSDDDYRLVEHTNRDDWKAFLAALYLVSWGKNAA